MTLRAIAGLVLFNAAALGAGAAILWGLRAYRWCTDFVRLAGLAHLLGLAAMMTLLSVELVVGIPVGGATVVVNLAVLAMCGLVVGILRAVARPKVAPPDWRFPRISLFVAVCVAGIVVYLEGLFRQARLSSTLVEWDGWWNWVPKAKSIYFFGRLDPEFLSFLPNKSYPPGLPALHAAAFHFMGSADDVTLHLQYWFYAAGFIAAIAGILAPRVRSAIFVPLFFLILLAPSFVVRFTWMYADVPLGFLVATAAVLVVIWIEERRSWQLVAASILFSGATLTKREGLLLTACALLAALAASATARRFCWPRIAIAGLVVCLVALPWWIWLAGHDVSDSGPSGATVGAPNAQRGGWATVRLVLTTLFEPDFWLLAPIVGAAAIALALLARAWTISIFACVFVVAAWGAGAWAISSEGFPVTTDDALNPVVRLTGSSVLVLLALTPLLLESAWSRRGAGIGSSPPAAVLGPDAFVWRSHLAWAIVLAAALAYPASMVVGYSGQTLPGGPPRFPSESDCVVKPVPGKKVRLVVGYADSYTEANELRALAAAAGIRDVRTSQDGCGRLRVYVDAFPTIAAALPLLGKARAAELEATLEHASTAAGTS